VGFPEILPVIGSGIGIIAFVYAIIRNVEIRLGNRIDLIERRFESRFATMDERFEAKFAAFAARLDSIDERIFLMATGKKLEDAILEDKIKKDKKKK